MTELPPEMGPFLLDVARHPEIPPILEKLLGQDDFVPRGVVHVGAHYGQEIELYMACGFNPILLVEANPAVFERLERHVTFWTDWLRALNESYGTAPMPQIIPVHAAASDRRGHVALHVTEHDPQSSILAPRDSSIRSRGTVEVACATVDQILAEQGILPETVGMLSIDAQGAEAMVLAGAAELLTKLDLVLTEVNYESRYESDATPEEIDRIMAEAGLEEIFRTTPLPDYPVVDVLYRRRG